MGSAVDRLLKPFFAPALRTANVLLSWSGRAVADGPPALQARSRQWLSGAGIAYLAALVLHVSVGGFVVAAPLVLVTVAIGAAWHAAERAAWAGFIAALWAPIHLLLLLSGGTSSPLLPLAVLWPVAIGLVGAPHQPAAAAAAAWLLVVVVDGWAGSATGSGILAAGVALAAGAVVGMLMAVQRAVAEAGLRRLAGIDAEAATGATAPEGRASIRLRELEEVLDRIRLRFGASRAVIWKVQPELKRARPAATAGLVPPTPVVLTGSQIAWAWEEELPLRLEGPLPWAHDAVAACISPLGAGRHKSGVLTLEWLQPDSVAELEVVAESAALLHTLLGAHRREARAVSARARADRLLELAGRLPERLDPLAFASELAESAGVLVQGTGALVATWDGEAGQVLAVIGEDGGPAAGAEFTAGGSELALAARGATTLRRRFRRTESRALPVATPGERWYAEPLALCVLPLAVPDGSVIGLLAVWSAQESTLDPDGLSALEGIAPFAAAHLRQARAYGALAAGPARPSR